MANKRIIYTLFICLAALGLHAQQAVVSATSGFKKANVYLYTIDDFVSGKIVLLDSTQADAEGKFTLKNPVKQTRYAYITLGELQYDLHLAPNEFLTVAIPDTVGFAIDSVVKPMVFNPGKPDLVDGLNTPIANFDSDYNEFVFVNYKAILRKTAQKTVSGFIKTMQEKYAGYTNTYVKDYIKYRIASLELSGYTRSEKSTIKEYFNNKPVLYTNDAYMDLFNQVFDDNLKEFSISSKGKGLLTAINVNADFSKALNELKRDTTLQNDTLRELYLIKGLAELFYRPDIVKYNIIEMLNYAANNAITTQNKQAARYMADKLDKLRVGTPAPAFTLKNIVNGEMVSLSNFKGKVVYLSFWDEDNPSSIVEIGLIKELEKQYGRKIAFVSICNSINETKTLAFINRNKYKWTFLNSKGNKQLLSDYEVLSYPAFYLIDANGNILKYPAATPSGKIALTLDDLTNKK